MILPNRKRPDLNEASPLVPVSSGEGSDSAPEQSDASAATSAALNVRPAVGTKVSPRLTPSRPRPKRRVRTKTLAAKSAVAAVAPVPDEPRPAPEPDYSEWDPRFNEIRRSHPGPLPPVETIKFDRRCTFASFMTGPGNQFAWMAAQSVAESPTRKYNPLVLYGPVGLGKTHLLHAIAQAMTAAGCEVVFTTAEAFTNDLVGSIRTKTMEEFRAKYRGAQTLIIDDFDFIAGKTSTEEEFFHTFNAVLANQGQIIVACSAAPRQIGGLAPRPTRSVCWPIPAAGLRDTPEDRTLKAAEQGVTLPQDVAEMLAQHEAENVCEIEGLLTQVTARASLGKADRKALAERALNRASAPQ